MGEWSRRGESLGIGRGGGCGRMELEGRKVGKDTES